MRLLNFILILILVTSVGCSKMKNKTVEKEGMTTDEASLDGEDADFIVDNDEMDSDLIAAEDIIEEQSGVVEEKTLETVEEVVATSDSAVAGTSATISGEPGTYRVESGETLMMIAFKLYGDYSRWREIQNMNSNISAEGLRTGMSLNYQIPSQKFEWNPSGEPYLVRSGDTLGTISMDKYGNTSRWKDIWNNNKPMIKNNPNLIFAGFTIYYIPDRDIASE